MPKETRHGRVRVEGEAVGDAVTDVCMDCGGPLAGEGGRRQAAGSMSWHAHQAQGLAKPQA